MTGAEADSTIFVPYGQGRGRGLDATELGAHGVEVDRLVALGLPVVPGLTMPVSQVTWSTSAIFVRGVTQRKIGSIKSAALLNGNGTSATTTFAPNCSATYISALRQALYS